MKNREQGLFLVEFAIIAVVLVIMLFGVIELSRIIWVWNTADEATRRGARVAAVCPINHPAVPEATIFAQAGSGGPSPVLRGLTTANVEVSYLDGNGDPETTYSDIKFVRVALVNYTLTPLIPFIDRTFALPRFETTIPSESLGLIPNPANPGAAAVCGCFGTNTACQP
jgi:Flp pilus assembly protein TadG